MIRTRRRSRRAPGALPEITLTPLIDTALTLLVIFMVTTPIIQNAIKVQLPKGNAKEDKGVVEEITVHIDKDQIMYVNGTKTTKDKLVSSLQKLVGPGTHKTVYVKADDRVAYGNVIDIVDHIKVMGGIEYVALATQKRA